MLYLWPRRLMQTWAHGGRSRCQTGQYLGKYDCEIRHGSSSGRAEDPAHVGDKAAAPNFLAALLRKLVAWATIVPKRNVEHEPVSPVGTCATEMMQGVSSLIGDGDASSPVSDTEVVVMPSTVNGPDDMLR
jgi:hypothetical protein